MDTKAELALDPFLTNIFILLMGVTGISLRSAGIFASQGRLLPQLLLHRLGKALAAK
jgi:hypothetical protein